jgi:hypothetical protein
MDHPNTFHAFFCFISKGHHFTGKQKKSNYISSGYLRIQTLTSLHFSLARIYSHWAPDWANVHPAPHLALARGTTHHEHRTETWWVNCFIQAPNA